MLQIKTKPHDNPIICLTVVFCLFVLCFAARATSLDNPAINKKPMPGKCKDCVLYDNKSQSRCSEMTTDADNDSRWIAGLSANMDHTILGGKIIAYRIRWQAGAWSNWYVPGYNDIDWKYNKDNNAQRRVWAYFFSHEHNYIICR